MTGADFHQRISAIRTILLLVGLYPYQQQTKLTRIQQALTSSILSSFIAFQFTSLATAKCTPYVVMKLFSCILIFIICLLIYNSFWFNILHVKYSLEQIEHNCYQLQDRNEISIIDKYAFSAKRITIIIIWVGIIFLILVHPMWPHILNRFLLINDTSSQRTILIPTEYFVDQEKYLYVIMLHMYAACCICVISTVGTGTILIVCCEHICGMLRIASYRISRVMEANIQRNIKEYRFINQEISMYKNILFAIDMHRKAINFSELLISLFQMSLFFEAMSSIICLSLNIFLIFQIITFGGKLEELFLHLAFIGPIVIYSFAVNYFGQEFTNHNNDVFVAVYNLRWYMAPLSIQKLILMLLQRGNKPVYVSFAGFFVASIEVFVKLMSTSLSYFTVMYSVQT